MSRINTNIPAIRAVHRLEVNHADLNLRLERLATGLRINRARDDPAGLIVSEILRSEMRGIRQAIANSKRASQVMATAEGAMNEVSALLLDLQGLIVEAANEAGLTDSEVAANQLSIDSILDSIDRIADTTKFAGKKLLDGTMAYTLSAVPPNDLASVAVFAAHIPHGSTREVTVRMTQSAQTAQVSLVGTNVGGVSQTSATTVEVRGTLGSELLSFVDGTDLFEIQTAINSITQATGVSAVVSTPAGGGRPARSCSTASHSAQTRLFRSSRSVATSLRPITLTRPSAARAWMPASSSTGRWREPKAFAPMFARVSSIFESI